MDNIFGIINFIASICSIISVASIFKSKEINKGIKILLGVNGILLLIVGALSFTYFKTIDPEQRAAEFYERYENISFENDLHGTKIRTAVSDGIVIMTDLDFEHKYPVLYKTIIKRYEEANNDKDFNRDKYVEIARDLFGAFGNLSKKLYKNNYYNKNWKVIFIGIFNN